MMEKQYFVGIDIGSTASMYAKEVFERYEADAVTVNPYMGYDTLKPFLDRADKGVFIFKGVFYETL